MEDIIDYFEKVEGNNWTTNKNTPIFHITNSKTVSDNIKYHVDKNGLNPCLNPQTIRKLCFTRLLKAFTLEQNHLYEAWTQHKISSLTRREYVKDIDDLILILKYGKIQEQVLIGNMAQMHKEVKQAKKDNGKYEELKKDFDELKQMVKAIRNVELAMGDGEKHPTPSEKGNMYRRK